jgi:hypothetical protein
MTFRSKFTLSQSLATMIGVLRIIPVVLTAWVGTATIFGFPVLTDEAAHFNQASAHRVDYEGSLNIRMLGKDGLMLALYCMLHGTVLLYCIHRPLFGACGGQLEIPSPDTLDQVQLTADSNSVEHLPSLHSHLGLQVSASYYSRPTLHAPRAQYNADRIRRTNL